MARPDNSPAGSRFYPLATVCLIVATLYFAQEVLVPLALALLFTFLLTPVVIRLERLHIPRAVATVSVVLLGLGLVALLAWTVSTQAMDLAYSLPRYQENIAQKLSHLPLVGSGRFDAVKKTVGELTTNVQPADATSKPTTQAGATAVVQPATWSESIARNFADALKSGQPLPVSVRQDTPEGVAVLQRVFSTVAAPLGTAFIVLIFVIFMLLRREDLRDRMIRLVGAGQLDMTTQAINDAGTRISRYLLMQGAINTCYGVTIGLGLWLIGKFAPGHPGFPNAALWGLLCGLLRFLPYVGPWLGAACPLVLSFAVFPGVRQFFFTAGMFISVETILGSVLEPLMYGTSTGLSAIAVLAAAVFWTWLWGPVGLLLSTPLTVCVVVIGKYVPALEFLDILLGDEPALPPPARLYQRLLALDAEEASDVVDEYRKTMPLEQVYDEVIIPALAMAEMDSHKGKLDERRHAEVRANIREIVDEMGDRERSSAVERLAKGAAEGSEADRPHLPQDCLVNVLLLPARDEADELSGIMLGQLLELRGYCPHAVTQNALASEMIEKVDEKSSDVVVVSAMPPDAVAHARYLCKRLHAKFPNLSMVVGLWAMQGDLKRPIERIACTGSVRFTASLRAALDDVHQLAQTSIARAAAVEA